MNCASLSRMVVLAFLAGACVAGSVLLVWPHARVAQAAGDGLAALQAKFRRPKSVPFPAADPFSQAKRALGERLFRDPNLSANGQIACATCHDPDKGLADGLVRSRGVPGHALARHTPALWNLAWGRNYFWDGRARSLEEQVVAPIENTDEMAQPLPALIARLAADPSYAIAFARAFPKQPRASVDHLAQALATYVRTLVSPATRFDRWVAGDRAALTPQEVEGFRLFVGKAGCANCHSGWNFTDSAFYDIGLADEDRGRGAVLRLAAAEHAFKAPSLREALRTAPYMHDGSIATLADVIRHYEQGIVDRPTLSPDLKRGVKFTEAERAALLAFLVTLSSEQPPVPPTVIVPATTPRLAPAMRAITVSQFEKAFRPMHVIVARGGRLWIVNNDTRTHNVRIFDPAFDFDSGAQEPGETVEIGFAKSGTFLVTCGIHPQMELTVEVRAQAK